LQFLVAVYGEGAVPSAGGPPVSEIPADEDHDQNLGTDVEEEVVVVGVGGGGTDIVVPIGISAITPFF